MLRTDISNFRNIRSAHLHDDAKLSLIVGYNESGKSSLIGAHQFAFTGSAFGHRGKEVSHLMTHGEERMHVRLAVGNLVINRTAATGDPLKGVADQLSIPTDVLPLLFDAKLAGDGGNKSMRAFLDGVASNKFDTVSHFANDPIVSNCLALAKRAGRTTTKQFIEYAETMRAASKDPIIPISPSCARPSAADLAIADKAVNQVSAELASAIASISDYNATGSKLRAISQYRIDLGAYEIAKAKASVGDKLLNRNQLTKLVNTNKETLANYKAILKDAGYSQTADVLQSAYDAVVLAVADANTKLAAHPAPPGTPLLPVLSAEVDKLYKELVAEALDTNEAISSMCVDAHEEGVKAQALKEKLTGDLAGAKAYQALLLKNEGAYAAYENALPLYETSLAKAQSDWKMWDDVAKRIAAAETAHINSAGDAFGKLVSEFSEFLLQGRKVVINRDTGITLGGLPIEDATESTKWRIEVCIMAAIARSANSPLLIIDAADILDDQNKACFLDFLKKRIVPFFEHVIVTATCRGKLEDEKPSSDPDITKWTIRNGELSRLQAAAAR